MFDMRSILESAPVDVVINEIKMDITELDKDGNQPIISNNYEQRSSIKICKRIIKLAIIASVAAVIINYYA